MSTDVINQEMEIVNGSDKPAKVYLEPWGNEQTVDAGKRCRIAFQAVADRKVIELEYFEGGIVVWFLTDATADFVE